MFKGASRNLALLCALLALGACASTARGVMSGTEPTYVASVEVVRHDGSAPTGFDTALHDAFMKAATLYGQTGRPIALKVELDRVHFKNPLKAMVVGDNDSAKGQVAVIDTATAQQLGTFKVQVDASRPSAGKTGAGVAMFVAEAFDPTGISSIADMAGHAASSDVFRSRTVAAMSANFAAESLRQTFGDARTRAANSAKRTETAAKVE